MTTPPSKYHTRVEFLYSAIENHNSDECLMWTFSVDRDGYGKLTCRENGKKLKVSAHRFAFKVENGHWPIPNGLHKCDNPGCFNPRHIFEGTTKDNHDDQVLKGRQLKGTQQGQAKLTEDIVLQARREYRDERRSIYYLANKYSVSEPAMKQAIEGVFNWKHVPDPIGIIGPLKTAKWSHCKKGHKLPENTRYMRTGVPVCKECKRIYEKGRRERVRNG